MIVDGAKFKAARLASGKNRLLIAVAGGYSSDVRVFQIEKNPAGEVPDIRLIPMCKAMGCTMDDVANNPRNTTKFVQEA